MRFQHQQKGLFTFYREQQLFQDQINQLKQNKKQKKEVRNQPKRKSNTTALNSSLPSHKIISQPNPSREDSPDRVASKLKRYGEAVAVFDRKQTECLSPTKNQSQSPPKQQLGCYLENKPLAFDINAAEQPSVYTKLKSFSKRKDRMRISQSKAYEYRRSTKLPSLIKMDNLDEAPLPQHKNMYSGSILRSNGSDLIREIRSKVRYQKPQSKEDRHVVSFFEFSRDYGKDLELRKKKQLTGEQQKLLEMLNRYRR